MNKDDVINYWKMVCIVLGKAHVSASERYAKRRTSITIVNIFASVMVLFLSLSSDLQAIINYYVDFSFIQYSHSYGAQFQVSSAKIAAGFAGAIVVVSSMIQYHLRYEERHIEHKIAGIEYFNLHKKIERMQSASDISNESMHNINKQMNYINKFTPPLAEKFMRGIFELLEKIHAHEKRNWN